MLREKVPITRSSDLQHINNQLIRCAQQRWICLADVRRLCTAIVRSALRVHKVFAARNRYIDGMEANSFVLVLTNGTHVIDAANARILDKAIDDRVAAVNLSVDLHGDGVRQTKVRIVTNHVVMMIAEDRAPDSGEEFFGVLSGKVRRLRV